MPNPLRVPIVLIAVFAVLLTFVHQHHRRYGHNADRPLFEQEDLQLRQPAGPHERATLVGPSLVQAEGSPGPHASPNQVTSPDEPSVAARLPGLNDRPAAADRQASAGATLWPPESFFSRVESTAASGVGDSQSSSAWHARATLAPGPVSTTDSRSSGAVMHRIVDGDTLPRLAETYLGDASRYGELLEANRDLLVHPDLLPLGVRIRIPAK